MEGNGLMAFKPPEGAFWVPLKINSEPVALAEDFTRNIEATLERGYTRFNELVRTEKSISVCGFAPSLKVTWKQLKGDVMACNRAHDFLLKQGVIPRWCLLMDPLEVVAQMVTPHPDVTYLVASRCHQAVFDKLKGFRVVVWHAAGDTPILPILEERGVNEPLVNGGTATVTRAMVMAVSMGYREINLFGCDSSFDGEHTHLEKSLVNEEEIHVMSAGRLFRTTAWMALQVEDIHILCPDIVNMGIKFAFYGDGLMQHVAKQLGYEVHQPLDEEKQ